MQLLKIILSLSLALTSARAFAAQAPDPETWMESKCRESNKLSCAESYGWHWLRKASIVIDPAIQTIAYSSTTYVLALVARSVIGTTPAVQFVLTVSQAGMKAGGIVILGGAAFVVVGTLASAGGFLTAMTTPTAGPGQDEPQTFCREKLDPFKSAEGIEKFRNLTNAEREELLPCIPQDRELSSFLEDVGRNSHELEKQIQRP